MIVMPKTRFTRKIRGGGGGPTYNHNYKQQRIDKSYVNRGDYIFGGGPTGMTLRNKKRAPYIQQKKRSAGKKKKKASTEAFDAPEIEEFTPDPSPELGPAVPISAADPAPVAAPMTWRPPPLPLALPAPPPKQYPVKLPDKLLKYLIDSTLRKPPNPVVNTSLWSKKRTKNQTYHGPPYLLTAGPGRLLPDSFSSPEPLVTVEP